MLLEHRKQQNESAEDELELPEVLMKTCNYTQPVSVVSETETLASVVACCSRRSFMSLRRPVWPTLAQRPPRGGRH